MRKLEHRPWWLWMVTVLVLLGTAGVAVWAASGRTDSLIAIATFVVLTLTLLVLTYYAYDTFVLASVARSKWDREGVLAANYSMEMIPEGLNPKGRLMFVITNPTTLMLRAKVICNFKIYGSSIDYHEDFNGKRTWQVFPNQSNRGWFEIESVLQTHGKSIASIRAERVPANRSQQLSMDLSIIFRDELGNERTLPTRRHFFDFVEWVWIPTLTELDDWKLHA